ncbi:MAG: NUDIX domain-containing protein [Solirubrobacteraceae bacterium]
MPFTVRLRRLGYRVAYWMLHLAWLAGRPARRGVKCALTDGDRVLLVCHTYGRRRWDLPGGTLQRRESAPAAARREMHEELGVDVADWTAIGELRGVGRHRRDTIQCFHAELRAPSLILDLGEIAQVHWFERERLPADIGPHVVPLLARVPGRG